MRLFAFARSIRVQMTIIFVVIFGGSLVAHSIYMYRTVDRVFQSEFDVLLYDFGTNVGQSINFSILGDIRVNRDVFKDERKIFPFSTHEALIQVRSMGGVLLAKSPNLGAEEIPLTPSDLQFIYKNSYFFRNWSQGSEGARRGQSYRVIHFLTTDKRMPKFIVQVAVPSRFVQENSRQVFGRFMYSIPVILLLSSILGYTFATTAFLPVRKMIEKAKAIRAGNLSERIPVATTRDEIADLGQTLNNLLARIEAAFASQERFVSDASHQLKTPLSILKIQLEDMHKSSLKGEEGQRRLVSMREEVDALISLVNNLLILAQVDASEQSRVFRRVPMDEVVTTAIQRLQVLAKRNGVAVNLQLSAESGEVSSEDYSVLGDFDLLVSLLQNLLENALKYSPAQSPLLVEVCNQAKNIRVSISDCGPGVPEEEMTRVFERFRRGAKACKLASGSGLGLSIAKRIADLHNGRLELKNKATGGLLASLILPKGD